jgi:hypothetical protein
MPKVRVDIKEAVRVTENHGGYLGAECIICGECGWLDGKYGYAHGTKNVMGNHLIHTKACPMNKHALKKWRYE